MQIKKHIKHDGNHYQLSQFFFTIHQNDRSAWKNMLVTILIHENLN